jgi:hypothetical protein
VENNNLRGMAKHGALMNLAHSGNIVLTRPLQRQLDPIPGMRGIAPA